MFGENVVFLKIRGAFSYHIADGIVIEGGREGLERVLLKLLHGI